MVGLVTRNLPKHLISVYLWDFLSKHRYKACTYVWSDLCGERLRSCPLHDPLHHHWRHCLCSVECLCWRLLKTIQYVKLSHQKYSQPSERKKTSHSSLPYAFLYVSVDSRLVLNIYSFTDALVYDLCIPTTILLQGFDLRLKQPLRRAFTELSTSSPTSLSLAPLSLPV